MILVSSPSVYPSSPYIGINIGPFHHRYLKKKELAATIKMAKVAESYTRERRNKKKIKISIKQLKTCACRSESV